MIGISLSAYVFGDVPEYADYRGDVLIAGLLGLIFVNAGIRKSSLLSNTLKKGILEGAHN